MGVQYIPICFKVWALRERERIERDGEGLLSPPWAFQPDVLSESITWFQYFKLFNNIENKV